MKNNYKILPEILLSEIPKRERPTREKKWPHLFDTLAFDKAIPLECQTEKGAKTIRKNILGQFRFQRGTYKIHTRLIFQNEKYIIYAWKEKGMGYG